jgi:aspartate-semialdehyde dehydrogenase
MDTQIAAPSLKKKRCGMESQHPVPYISSYVLSCSSAAELLRVLNLIFIFILGILGATGAVGTRFVVLLENHPHFEIVALAASARSAGKRYADVTNWKHTVPIPTRIADMIVRQCTPSELPDCDIVFSGLDASVAGEVETAFLMADVAVFSNAKNHRLAPLIPLVVPTVNLRHSHIIPAQRQHFKLKKGLLVCNSNCAGKQAMIVRKSILISTSCWHCRPTCGSTKIRAY